MCPNTFQNICHIILLSFKILFTCPCDMYEKATIYLRKEQGIILCLCLILTPENFLNDTCGWMWIHFTYTNDFFCNPFPTFAVIVFQYLSPFQKYLRKYILTAEPENSERLFTKIAFLLGR